ncbi:MAG: C25 family cysteine peptidase, partial [Planctomycetota bacterium]
LPALQSLADWKNSIGIPCIVKDVAEIGNDSTAIKNYITGMYYTTDLSFVLIVGDYLEVDSPFHAGGVSDPSYSVVTADPYPDLLVGRFSASTIPEVETQVERTLQYEHEGHDLSMKGWNAAAMGIAASIVKDHMDGIRDALMAGGFLEVDRIYDPGASKTEVIDGLHEGRRLVNYCGQGSTTMWGTTGFNVNDILHLANTDKLPFVHSAACYGGDFNKGTCLGEAWLRAAHEGKPAGAVASYNASTLQYWNEPQIAQLKAVEYFLDETMWSVGGCWYGGSCRMIDLFGMTGWDTFMTWNLFGDPSLRLSGVPELQTLKADAWVIPLDTAVDIQFNVDMGPDHAGDNYCILSGYTGTLPGTLMPGGLEVPLNFDDFTWLALSLVNSPVFKNFYGKLDSSGSAEATLSTQGLTPLSPHLAGTKLFFVTLAWPGGGAFEAATNPKMLTLVE